MTTQHDWSTATPAAARNSDGDSSAAATDGRLPLRILRIASDVYPTVVGGGSLHVHAMSAAQAAAGHTVHLLTSDHGDRTLPRHETVDGYEVTRYREVVRPFGNSLVPGFVSGLVRLAAEYDVVHAHSHLYFTTNVAALFARVSDTPLVVTNHGLESQTAPEWVQRVYLPTVARFTLDGAETVFCYTEEERAKLRALGVDAPVAIVNNGIDTDLFSPVAGVDRRRQLLFVGRLKADKGVGRLFDAFVAIAETTPDVTLKIVGDGPLREELQRRTAELGLDARVEITGDVPNEQLPALYTESALLVLPSKAEGLPRTVLEALACETPVVTTALPQLLSLVDGVGETVPYDATDVSALVETLSALLADDSRRAAMGERGRRRVVDEYSWAETVRQTTDVYYRLLGLDTRATDTDADGHRVEGDTAATAPGA